MGTTPWYLRLLRDEGAVASHLAHLLASSRYAVELLEGAPEAVQLLADEASLRPRPRATLASEVHGRDRAARRPRAGGGRRARRTSS